MTPIVKLCTSAGLVAALFMMQGCEALQAPPDSTYNPMMGADTVRPDSVALLVDVVHRDAIEEEYVVINLDASARYSQDVRGWTLNDLEENAAEVVEVPIRFVGGFFEGTFNVRESLDAEITQMEAPFPRGEGLTEEDIALAGFVSDVRAQLVKVLQYKLERLYNLENEASAQAQIYAQEWGTRYALVCTVVSHEVPNGRQFGQAMLTGMLTGGAVMVNDADYQRVAVVLVDLEDGVILWHNEAFTNTNSLDRSGSNESWWDNIVIDEFPHANRPSMVTAEG